MDEGFEKQTSASLRGRLFIGLCLPAAIAFAAGCCFFFASSFVPAADSLAGLLAAFFVPADSPPSFSFFVFGELKFLLLIGFSGLTSAAPLLAFAIPSVRAFSAGFAACGLLAAGFGRFPFLIFTIFFAFTLVIEAYASSIACLYALFRQHGETDRPSAPIQDRLSYAAAFLTPAGLTVLLALAKEGLLLLI